MIKLRLELLKYFKSKGYLWLTRNNYEYLELHKDKPIKQKYGWSSNSLKNISSEGEYMFMDSMLDSVFDFISCQGEPLDIDEFIKIHE